MVFLVLIYLSELDQEELIQVFNNNNKLQEMVFEDWRGESIEVTYSTENYDSTLNYFLNQYVDHMSPNCFIENDKYILYEQVEINYDTGEKSSLFEKDNNYEFEF